MLDTVKLFQQHNERISGIEWAPPPSDYPHSIEAFMWPTALTTWLSYDFWRAGDNRFAEGELNVIVFLGALGIEAATLGLANEDVLRLQDNVVEYYLAQESYAVKGGTLYIVQKEPVRIQILSAQPTFEMSGARILEHPEKSDNWFHGFDLRFDVSEQWPRDCIRSEL